MLEQHYELTLKLGNTNTIERTVKEIVDSIEYQTVWNEYWYTNKLIVCARTCGVNTEFAKPGDQVVTV